MITVTAFDTRITCTETSAKQFARHVLIMLNGNAVSAVIPARLGVRLADDGSYTVRRKANHKPTDFVGATAGEIATEALKFARATVSPEAKVVNALTKIAELAA